MALVAGGTRVMQVANMISKTSDKMTAIAFYDESFDLAPNAVTVSEAASGSTRCGLCTPDTTLTAAASSCPIVFVR